MCEIDGIVLFGGTTSCCNNLINLGAGVSIGSKINGIWDEGASGSSANIWFNTIYICGSVTAATTSATAAIWDAANASTRNYRNNLLINARTGGATGKHYAIVLSGTSNTTIDNNDYFVSGTGGVIGRFGPTDKTTLATWKLSTAQDASSLNTDPQFQFAGGTYITNYYAASNLPAYAGTGILTDYEGIARGTAPKMGALESNRFVWQGAVSADFGTAANWSGHVVPVDGADITFSVAPSNHCVLDHNRTVGVITNSQSTYALKLNGHHLTISGQTAFTNGARINASDSGSMLVYAGTSLLNIPPGTFENSVVDALTINNGAGVTLNDELTVNRELALAHGAFILGNHTLNINGAITVSNGTLSGGDSTNINIGGSGQSTGLPAITVNNLDINRTEGVLLVGDVIVKGTLTLTEGTVVLGPHKLFIEGNSPLRINGSIDAGNVGADLIFGSDVPITLTASTFIGKINNVTFNNTSNGTSNINIATPLTINGYAEFNNGIVYFTDNGSLLFSDSATCNGGSINSFVNGSVAKAGSESFTFPVGTISMANEKIWAPLKMSAPGQLTDTFSCVYNFTPPPDFDNTDAVCDPGELEQLSGVEYWDLQRVSGTSTPDVTLFWKDASRSGISDSSKIIVAHYGDCNGETKWVAMPKVQNPVNEPGGSITGTGFTSYSPLTFGLKPEGNPLPIELLNFSAACSNVEVALNWTTATENNNDFFTIERSQDAINWEVVGTYKGSGNSSHISVYAADDKQPLGGTTYYRLKQTDYDGKFEYFAPVVTDCGKTNETIVTYYPNPFSTEILMNTGILANDRGTVQVFDTEGKRVFTMAFSGSDLNSGKVLLPLSDLPSGVYFIEFKTGDLSSSTKIIKK